MPSKQPSSKRPSKHKLKEADILQQHDKVVRQEMHEPSQEGIERQIMRLRRLQAWRNHTNKSILSEYSMEPLFLLPPPGLTPLVQDLSEHKNELSIKDIQTLGIFPLQSPEDAHVSAERMSIPLEFPFSCVGIVTFLWKQQPQFSTGTIVGKNIILTAAHNCFNILRGDEFHHIRFSIPVSANRWHTFKAKNIFIPEEFEDLSNSNRLLYDFCFIQVEAEINLEDYFGCLALRLQNANRNICTDYNKKAFISGFSQDLEGNIEAKKTEIKIEDDFDILRYGLGSGNTGHLSGAPIISDQLEIIGLHIHKSHSNSLPSFGLASISWLLSDFVTDFLYKDARVAYADSPLFTPEEPETVETIRLDLHYRRQLCTSQTSEQKADQICQFIAENDWPQLRSFYTFGLPANFQYYDQPLGFLVELDARHCRVLSQANIYNLRTLSIQGSMIGDEGCRWLSTANWNLTYISVVDNGIGNIGLNHLLRGGWINLRSFHFGSEDEYSNQLENNNFDRQQICSWKRLSQSKQLLNMSSEVQSINENPFYVHVRQLRSGHIDIFNVQLLTKWKNLQYLELSGSNLSNKGCAWIHQGQLRLLEQINLQSNNFDDWGVKWLAKSIWKKLRLIDLRKNHLTPISCSFIFKSLWGDQYLSIYHGNMRKQGSRWVMIHNFPRNDRRLQRPRGIN